MWKAIAALMIGVFVTLGCEPNPNEPLVQPENQVGVPDGNVPETPSQETAEESADRMDGTTEVMPDGTSADELDSTSDLNPGTNP